MSFAKMDLDKVICSMVEMCLPRFSPEDTFLHVPIEIKVNNSEKDITERKEIHFLFHRPGNYTKVFVFEANENQHFDAYYKNKPMDFWTLESYHGSCWKSDGVNTPLNRIYSEFYKKLGIDFRKDKSEYISFGLIGPKLLNGYLEKNYSKSNEYEKGSYIIYITGDKK